MGVAEIILKYFLYSLFSFSVFGQSVAAQVQTKVCFDASINQLQNTKNNENWARFAGLVNENKNIHKTDLSIVHIGDSHIQGGFYTNRFRELLYMNYGVKQRGFIFPYSLVKANGPEDVKFFSTSAWSGEKYNHSHRKEKVGITGYFLHLDDSVGKISISLKQGNGPLFSFQELVVYHNNKYFHVSSEFAIQTNIDSIEPQLYASHVFFRNKIDSVSLLFNCQARTQFFGFELKNSQSGIVYHTMGVNGASFETFTNSIDYMSILKAVHPNCIIISLGTNDSYLRQLDTMALKRRIIAIIETIRNEFPGSCILLTTPGDHLIHKKYLNENLIKASAVIVSTALEQKCVYWDFFSIMGGLGSSKRWAQNGLMYRDMLHLSKEGYKLQGDLFFEAFNKAIEGTQTSNQ